MNSQDLISACLKGKEGAWTMLVNNYSRRIFNLSFQFAGSYAEAEDLTQDIFLKLYKSLKKYDFNKNFDAWLTILAKNHLIDHYRKTKWEHKQRDDFDEKTISSQPGLSPENGLLRKEKQKQIWSGLNQISPEIRMAVILRDIQGRDYEEIAAIMNLPLGTVKSRINRGRIYLAKILIKKGGTDELL